MKKLKALFRKAWELLDDDRIGLILTGVVLVMAVIDFKSGEYAWVVGDMAFAIVIGVSAWFGHANKLREARG
ncbi:hypothetical protein Dolphis_85 [Pseudomonas phage Dolphis]|nr:hypothetical protein Dolphis_85 [Pseudomonas phage Dolphis]